MAALYVNLPPIFIHVAGCSSKVVSTKVDLSLRLKSPEWPFSPPYIPLLSHVVSEPTRSHGRDLADEISRKRQTKMDYCPNDRRSLQYYTTTSKLLEFIDLTPNGGRLTLIFARE